MISWNGCVRCIITELEKDRTLNEGHLSYKASKRTLGAYEQRRQEERQRHGAGVYPGRDRGNRDRTDRDRLRTGDQVRAGLPYRGDGRGDPAGEAVHGSNLGL